MIGVGIGIDRRRVVVGRGGEIGRILGLPEVAQRTCLKAEGVDESGIHGEVLKIRCLLLSGGIEGQHFVLTDALRRKKYKVGMVPLGLHARSLR